jgi:hypothetical protein
MGMIIAISIIIGLMMFLSAIGSKKPEKPSVTDADARHTAVAVEAPQNQNQVGLSSFPQPTQAPTNVADKIMPGVARVCLTDEDVNFGGYRELKLPATVVFEDAGPLSGRKEDPSSWNYTPSIHHAALVTLDPTIFTKSSRCSNVKVQMLVGPIWTERHAKASDDHVFTMTDVLDYPIPLQKPPIETGKLIDDVSVKAVLLADVDQWKDEDVETSDDASKAATCLEGAEKLAASLGGGIGRQTSMIVEIGGLSAEDVSYGCALGPKSAPDPDLFVAWDRQAKPPAATRDLIAKGGEFLTGAPRTELLTEAMACVADALKPEAGEMGSREFRGVKVECQAFSRDGGGGSVTVYRRFGAYPARPTLSVSEQNALRGSSGEVRAEDDKKAADALSFAKWWEDPAIPKNVKVFAMMTARIISLSERCTTWKPRRGKIEEMAASAGVEPSDIAPNGKYFALMAMTMRQMQAETARESVANACEEAKRYD